MFLSQKTGKRRVFQLFYIHTNSPNHIYIIWIIYIIYYLLYYSKSYYLLYCKALTLSLTFVICLFFPLILFLLSLCFWYQRYLYTISLKAKKGLLKEYTETFFFEYTCIIYIYIYIHIHTKLPVNAIVRPPHAWSRDSQGQETFLAHSADK